MMTITVTKETMYALAQTFLAPEVPEISKTQFIKNKDGIRFGIKFTSSVNYKHEYFIYLEAYVRKATAIIRESHYADDGKRSSNRWIKRLSIAQLRKLGMLQETSDLIKT